MDYASQQRNPKKHAISITAVLLLHLLIFWALANGLAQKAFEKIKKPIEAKLIQEIKPPHPTPATAATAAKDCKKSAAAKYGAATSCSVAEYPAASQCASSGHFCRACSRSAAPSASSSPCATRASNTCPCASTASTTGATSTSFTAVRKELPSATAKA